VDKLGVKQKPTDQAKAFRKAARELGCEPDEKRFQDALRKVAKHKPQSETPKKKHPDRD